MFREMLKLDDVWVKVDGRLIIKGASLKINCGETHVLFGPNGSGKTTLIKAIMGFQRYKVIKGKIYFKGEDITDLPLSERAKLGIGISFQEAPAITGVRLGQLLDVISNNKNHDELKQFIDGLRLGQHINREVNVGFSGGEKKRAEILQLLAQDPDLVLLDEPESGVDIENIELIGKFINKLLQKDIPQNEMIPDGRKKCGLIITHTGHILDYVTADKGYVMLAGKIVCSGNPWDLLRQIRKNGFGKCKECFRIELGKARYGRKSQ